MDTLIGTNKSTNINNDVFTPATLFFLISVLWLNGGLIRISYKFNATVFLIISIIGIFFAFIEFASINKKAWTDSGIIYGILFFALILPNSLKHFQTLNGESTKVLYAIILLLIQLYLKRRSRKTRKLFANVIMVDCIVINIRTIMLLIESPELSRIFASGGEAVMEEGFTTYLLGGYGYIYALIFAVLFLFIRKDALKTLTSIEKFICYSFIISGVITIIMAQYTIAILTLIMGMLFVMISRQGITIQSILTFFVLFTFIILISEFVLNYLVENKVFGDVVTNRLGEMISTSGNDIYRNGDLEYRKRLYMVTIKKLPQFFIGGVYGLVKQPNTVLGWHTEWFDKLVYFGIIRYWFFLKFLTKGIKYSLPNLELKTKYVSLIICLIVLGCINPILTANFYVVLFVFIPFVLPTDTDEGALRK